MLEYDKIDISEGIDINKRNLSRECDMPLLLFFRQNGCHDLMPKTLNLMTLLLCLLKEMIIEFIYGI